MNYWLVKSEPYKYSWNDLEKDGKTFWDGVRNYQARNNLKSMKKGDLVLYYHSNEGKEIVGIAKVIKEYYQDPTTDDTRWVAVDIEPYRKFKKPVTLKQIKEDEVLQNIGLIKQPRLSVMPVKREEFDRIVELGMQE
ncbi:MAG: EVE domain-containing protein [Bacteroidetes bacterium]|nr:MAG: EVE domain-containing protein [Bacteroidota bacterium]